MNTLRRRDRLRVLCIVCVPMACLSAQDSGAVLRTIHSFHGGPHDGSEPIAGVAVGAGGVLYGTTFHGGLPANCADGCGVVYSLTPPTAAGDSWTEQVLYRFTGGAEGGAPYGGIAVGSDGVLYGTTIVGGAGYGTVFSLTPPVSPGTPWTLATLWTFSGGDDGGHPYGGVIIGDGGVLYGSTFSGGNGAGSAGIVYSLTPSLPPGGLWTEAVLWAFSGFDGLDPLSPLTMGIGGVLYGTTELGGLFMSGSVFSLTPPAAQGGSWTFDLIFSFGAAHDGAILTSGLVINAEGFLYGTTNHGGGDGCGTIYSLSRPGGGTWSRRILYSFTCGTDGANPYGGLVIGPGGVVYTTAMQGGATSCISGCGTVISLTPPESAGGKWTEALVYQFTGGNDGAYPQGTLVRRGGSNVFFGTTGSGGAQGSGTVFTLTP